MKTTVIPDVHNKISIVDRILSAEEADEYIFLGDWFDSFGDKIAYTGVTCDYLSTIIGLDKYVFLLGNHDVSYLDTRYACSGWTIHKQSLFTEKGGESLVRQFKLWHESQGIIFSHAGFNKNSKYLLDKDQALIWGDEKLFRDFNSVSRVSGGNNAWDGPLWHRPTISGPYINERQIVGHTPHKEPTWYDNTLVLDSGLHHYAVVVDGQVEIKKVSDLT